MFHGHLDYLKIWPLGGRPNTKLEDHVIAIAHSCSFILFYHVRGPAWIEIHWNSIWLTVPSHMTLHYTWGPVTTLHDFRGELGRPLETFFWALTIIMVTALGSCVKWPQVTWNVINSGLTLHAGSKLHAALAQTYDRAEPTVNYKWTGGAWEITGWSSRLQENYWSF